MKKLISVISLAVLFSLGAVWTVSAQDNPPFQAKDVTVDFEIGRLVMATGIESREPSGVADVFPADTPKVYCFLEAKNIALDADVVFVWIYNGKEVLTTFLPLKAGARWRTAAEKSLYQQAGDWKVEIRDTADHVMGSVQFKVE